MLPSFATESVEVLTAVQASDHGRNVADWSQSPASVTVSGCSFQPFTGAADDDNRTGSQQLGLLLLPPDTTINARNHVRIRGDDYEIVGEPEVWTVGVGNVDHVAVNLDRWEG